MNTAITVGSIADDDWTGFVQGVKTGIVVYASLSGGLGVVVYSAGSPDVYPGDVHKGIKSLQDLATVFGEEFQVFSGYISVNITGSKEVD